METACSYGSKRSIYSPTSASDVSVEVALEGDGPCVGQDAVLSVLLKNSSSAARSVDLYSQVAAMRNSEANKTFLKKDRTRVELKPHEGEIKAHMNNTLKTYI